ncbi:hypothetical protein D3C84_673150 [compost metagenome]
MVQQHTVAAQTSDPDQSVVAQLGPADRGAFRQLMIPSTGQYERFVYQRNEFDVGVLAAHHVDTEVGFTTQHRLQAFISAQVEQADADFRVAFVVNPNHRRQEIKRRGGDTGQGDTADLAFCQLANVQNGIVEIVQQPARLGQEIASDAGQADFARGAIEQGSTQSLFQLFNPPTQRWLRKVKCIGGFVEAAEFGDFHERSDVLKLIFHRHLVLVDRGMKG